MMMMMVLLPKQLSLRVLWNFCEIIFIFTMKIGYVFLVMFAKINMDVIKKVLKKIHPA